MLRTTAGLLAAGAAAARGADPFNCTQQPANAFTAVRLTNNVPGMEIDVIPYGATLQRFLVPDAKGVPRDVILGFDDATLYCSATTAAGAAQHPYFGALIGRVANRIANGSFELNGATVHTPINEQYSHGPGGDTLHGGTVGFDRRVWDVLAYNGSSVTFGLLSRDGEMGFPGALAVAVTYTLTDAPRPAWDVAYEAHALTADTVVALSQHTYWNLGGFVGNTEDALATVLEMPTATAYVAVDDNLIPTGDVPPVSSAPWLDFTTAKAVGRDIANGTVAPGGGYDNAWVNPAWTPGAYADFATVSSPLTGISMVISTDQPSVQVRPRAELGG